MQEHLLLRAGTHCNFAQTEQPLNNVFDFVDGAIGFGASNISGNLIFLMEPCRLIAKSNRTIINYIVEQFSREGTLTFKPTSNKAAL
jgi:hypothetical protein